MAEEPARDFSRRQRQWAARSGQQPRPRHGELVTGLLILTIAIVFLTQPGLVTGFWSWLGEVFVSQFTKDD
jgi:UPF0716 family protein affecting phage T7 exclusion